MVMQNLLQPVLSSQGGGGGNRVVVAGSGGLLDFLRVALNHDVMTLVEGDLVMSSC